METARTFAVGDRRVGASEPVFIVAELSANHHHSLDHAVKLVEAAAYAGADAVKLQTYTADTLTIDANTEHFRVGGGTLWDGRTLHDLYKEAYTPWEWHATLQREAHRLGLAFFSTPFDNSAVDFLDDLGVPIHKVASFENVDLQLLTKVARSGKPVIMSTGMATLAEIDEAVSTLRNAGCKDLVLLKCTSSYPADPAEMNLRTIPHLREAFGVHVGISDHTMGSAVPIAAVALGARVIEKHLTLTRDEPGPDSAFSMEPHEFRAMVDAAHVTERALGRVHYGVAPSERKSRAFRRSLFVVEDVKEGETFTSQNVRSIRPGDGLHTRHLDEVLGRKATRDAPRGTPMAWSLVGGR